MKIMYLIIVSLFLISCKAASLEDTLNKELQKKSEDLNITYKEKQEKKVTWTIPIFPDDTIFSKKIEENLKHTLATVYQILEQDCKNSGEAYLDYRVLHLTNNFISIIKQVSYSSCYGREVYEEQYLNLFYYQKFFYKIELNEIIKSKPFDWAIYDKECVDGTGKELKALMFEKNKPYMYVSKGKLCSTEQVIDLNKSNFKITPIEDKTIFETFYFD